MKKLLLLTGLMMACGGTPATPTNDLWSGSVEHGAAVSPCVKSNSVTFKFVVENSITKQACATVFASVPVGFLGRQELNPNEVYSCSAVPGNKEVVVSVIYDSNDLPLNKSVLGFSDYPNANHLYLDLHRNNWGTCKNSVQFVDLSADWILTH